MSEQNAVITYLLRLGDNGLVLGHRLSEWCGHAPELEEDLALANTALDLIGQAQLWLSLAAAYKGKDCDADTLAYRRDVAQFHNVLLVEQPNGDYAETMARQLYFDAWHYILLENLSMSRNSDIADIAGKAVKEARYHIERSRRWVICLGDGTAESHMRMQKAVNNLWMYTGELFENDEIDRQMMETAEGTDMSQLRDSWLNCIKTTLKEATLTVPNSSWMQSGGKTGTHSEHLGYLLAEMQYLQRAYPDACW